MATIESSASAHETTRELRALALYREHHADIVHVGDEAYLVPSGTHPGAFYRVVYRHESCSCPDATYHRGLCCKHVLMVGIHRAKTRARTARCEGCDERFPRREMVEVADSIRYFEGDLLCRSCFDASDVVPY